MVEIYINNGYISDNQTYDTVCCVQEGCTAYPGFIDIHTHGGYGYDFMTCTPEEIKYILRGYLCEGITSVLATTMTEDYAVIEKALEKLGAFIHEQREAHAQHTRLDEASLLGIHLEGPFINAHYKGAQDEQHIRLPSAKQLRYFQEKSYGTIRYVTFAPECDKDFEMLEIAKECNIIPSVGHSDASFAVIEAACKHGLQSVTHTFNAQSAFHHRSPGVVPAALFFDNLSCELIVDGIHVHKDSVRTLFKLKPKDKILLITDAMQAKGCGDGMYILGGQDVHVSDGEARLSDGTLAGSVLQYNEILQNILNWTTVTYEECCQMTSRNQAQLLGYETYGSLDRGYIADIVVLDAKGKVCSVYHHGKKVIGNHSK